MYNTLNLTITNLLDKKVQNSTFNSENDNIIKSKEFKINYTTVMKGEYEKYKNYADFTNITQLHNHSGIKNNTIKIK